MSLFIKRFIIIGTTAMLCGILLYRCGKKDRQEYARHAGGYYYKLISFSTDTFQYRPGYMVHLAASYSTQNDSVFWDSDNNLNDNFFMKVDSSVSGGFFKQYSSCCAVGDSVCLLIKTPDFFLQQFNASRAPFFSGRDSVVKVRFKVKQLLSATDFSAIHHNLAQKEQEQIRRFFGSEAAFAQAKDSLGFYWVENPGDIDGKTCKPGNTVTLSYRGSYLNGRFLEVSPEKFELVYGTPDQLLKGLNYVIPRIKLGQNAKIILPSRLAFGEKGSSNEMVPPYTPLLYEIKITDIKE